MVGKERVEEFLRRVAKASLSVLMLDYDGTLAPFSVKRSQALPYEGLSNLVQRIVDSGRTRLVIVTGRDAREIAPLLGLQTPPEVWGVHGLQRLRPDGTCEMPQIPARVARSLNEARRWLIYQRVQDLAEIKTGSIAVHWRGLDEVAAWELRGRILLGWFEIAQEGSLKVMEFDGGLEMRMPDLDKGHAVHTILMEVGPNVPLAYMGDDTTDEHAFQALGQKGLTVLVHPQPRGTSAQARLETPEELMEFLRWWVKAAEVPARAAHSH